MHGEPPGGYVDVGAVGDYPDGGTCRVRVGETDLALFRSGDGFYALLDRCPHAGAPLSDGALEGHVVSCSWHAWRFDVRDGRSLLVPSVPPVPCHDVRVAGGRVLVSAAPRSLEDGAD